MLKIREHRPTLFMATEGQIQRARITQVDFPNLKAARKAFIRFALKKTRCAMVREKGLEFEVTLNCQKTDTVTTICFSKFTQVEEYVKRMI
jgi:hypothetical protein